MEIRDFIKSAGLSMSAAWTDHNPNMDDEGRAPMDHWRCTIRSGKSRMSLVFSMGAGHDGKRPELADVLDCLASEAAGLENSQNFDDWCAEYGYDTDSRRAERTFKAIERHTRSLRRVLSESAYRTLLWDVERL